MTRRFGFTLAEVLITLGIIGVVASMTIPTLVANYNTKQWNTAATVFDRKIEEALKTMNTQASLAGHTTTESFVDELSKHFKTNKICKNDELLDCFSETVYWGGGDATPEEVDMSIIKTAKNFGQNDWNTNIVGVQFANGTSAMIAYNPTNTCTQDPYSNQVTGGDCLAILYDTSGEKNPNTSGKDLRSNGNVTKLGKGCAFEIGGTCYTTAPFLPTPHIWNSCSYGGSTTTGITSDPDDQKFMSDYGIAHCCASCGSSGDYWAGAVKACGGVDKMSTSTQLADIANYIYNTDSINQSATTYDLTFDPDKATSIGFKLTPDSNSIYFHIWSGEETGTYHANSRYFHSSRTGLTEHYVLIRGESKRQAVCVE